MYQNPIRIQPVIAVAADMIPPLQHKARFPGLHHLMCKHRAIEPRSDNQIVKHYVPPFIPDHFLNPQYNLGHSATKEYFSFILTGSGERRTFHIPKRILHISLLLSSRMDPAFSKRSRISIHSVCSLAPQSLTAAVE